MRRDKPAMAETERYDIIIAGAGLAGAGPCEHRVRLGGARASITLDLPAEPRR